MEISEAMSEQPEKKLNPFALQSDASAETSSNIFSTFAPSNSKPNTQKSEISGFQTTSPPQSLFGQTVPTNLFGGQVSTNVFGKQFYPITLSSAQLQADSYHPVTTTAKLLTEETPIAADWKYGIMTSEKSAVDMQPVKHTGFFGQHTQKQMQEKNSPWTTSISSPSIFSEAAKEASSNVFGGKISITSAWPKQSESSSYFAGLSGTGESKHASLVFSNPENEPRVLFRDATEKQSSFGNVHAKGAENIFGMPKIEQPHTVINEPEIISTTSILEQKKVPFGSVFADVKHKKPVGGQRGDPIIFGASKWPFPGSATKTSRSEQFGTEYDDSRNQQHRNVFEDAKQMSFKGKLNPSTEMSSEILFGKRSSSDSRDFEQRPFIFAGFPAVEEKSDYSIFRGSPKGLNTVYETGQQNFMGESKEQGNEQISEVSSGKKEQTRSVFSHPSDQEPSIFDDTSPKEPSDVFIKKKKGGAIFGTSKEKPQIFGIDSSDNDSNVVKEKPPKTDSEKESIIIDFPEDIFPKEMLPAIEYSPPVDASKKSTTLVAIDVPQNYLEKGILSNHFSKFGNLSKILINRKSNQASIFFANHESAAKAKSMGKKLHPLVPEMKLLFRPPPVKKTKTTVLKRISPSLKDSSPKQLKIEKQYEECKEPKIGARASPSPHLKSVESSPFIIKQKASNHEDAYLILDSRDKLIRGRIKKVSELSQAKYFSGTCPDMCPEKERYSRERQYDLSVYEMTNGELNHCLAVKKFSRSSADKDEPLPHELRPSSVLSMTMDHLICNVISKQDDESTQNEVWYNFIWNRTRGLRNDIMQQHLSDSTTVEVLEKCTRFHIHCSHHLCEESCDVFDPKMNMEHLIKSLQSLKEAYHDLAEKGIYSSSESEIRSYEILLNINDGNVIFHYINFRDDVRNSGDVKFAIKVLLAVQSNNYSRFFQLVTEGTYLQACILHSHFKNIRSKAIKTVIKAYHVPNNPQTLSLDKLGQMLGFTCKEELKYFLSCYGFDATLEEITIDKRKYISKPEATPSPGKTTNLDYYQEASIGKIIQGGALPINPLTYYKPHDSFNQDSFLTPSALDAIDQSAAVQAIVNYLPSRVVTVDLSTEELELRFAQKVKLMHKLKLMNKYFKKWQQYTDTERIIKTFREKRKLILLKKFLDIWRAETSIKMHMNAIADVFYLSKWFFKWKEYVVHSKEMKTLRNEAKIVQLRLNLKRIVAIWRQKAKVSSEAGKLAAIRERVVSRKMFISWKNNSEIAVKLRQAAAFYDQKMQNKYFHKWKKWMNDEKEARLIDHENFPAIGSQLTEEEQNELLGWRYDRNSSLNMAADQFEEINCNNQTKLNRRFVVNKLTDLIVWSPLQLQKRFHDDLDKCIDNHNILSKCFKLLILIDNSTDPYLVEWVRTKLNFSNVSDVSQRLFFKDCLTSNKSGSSCFVIVVEKEMPLMLEDADGASAIIFVTQENKLNQSINHMQAYNNLPSLILCWSSNNNFKENIWCLNQRGIYNPTASEKLLHLIIDFWQLRDKASCIHAAKLQNVASSFTTKEVLAPLCKIKSQREHYRNIGLPFGLVVEFYNDAVSHFIQNIEDMQLPSSWPPSELVVESEWMPAKAWDSEEKRKILSTLETLYLPPFQDQDQQLEKVISAICCYILSIVQIDKAGQALTTEVFNIISNIEEQMKSEFLDVAEGTGDAYLEIPFIDILSSCIFYKLSLLPDVKLFYDPDSFGKFLMKDQWMSKLRLYQFDRSLLSKENVSVTKRKAEVVCDDVDAVSKSKKVHFQLHNEFSEEKKKSRQLLEDLELLFQESEELSTEII